MSFYADYVREITTDEIIENESGFMTYRFLNDGKTVYIVDMYIVPAYRQKGAASAMADTISDIARSRGASELLGTVRPSNKGSTESTLVLIAYGLKLKSSTEDLVVYRKDL